ncbi:MAG: hypothetical protein JW874_00855 [Spirochaetales bacterium]|nr:hypothetical protein [Spirochaetales bacterium]
MHRIKLSVAAMLLLIVAVTEAQDTVRVATWNIEHLGTDGRGFGGGYGAGSLPRRTDAQLAAIGIFIRDSLQADVLALQEIAISHIENGLPRSAELDKICLTMGPGWQYALPPLKSDHSEKSLYVAFLWNGEHIRPRRISPLDLENPELAGNDLFDRIPLAGCFEAVAAGETKNDFLLVNVHLSSGKHNEENHLIAMTLIEYSLNRQLREMGISESDRIILGDFNDNPYQKKENGDPAYSPALYTHMRFKGYSDYVCEDFHSTRMDNRLQSIIDHILINNSAARHVVQNGRAEIWIPPDAPSSFADWRVTYSDHFPLFFDITVRSDDDSD